LLNAQEANDWNSLNGLNSFNFLFSLRKN